MKPLSGQAIRQMWLDFFVSKGHHIMPSANLIPFQDPTLLWINSGVAAMKKYFDGTELPTHRRLTNAQKSLRTNDIEQVGYTARHHTFFEMLGNFSIGDYFRDDVIPWAYELLTSPQWFGFDPDKLYMTYSPLDEATKKKWLACGVQDDHLIPLDGNFWEIGEGPSGPDTEIFYDRGPSYDPTNQGVNLLREDRSNDRYIEIWNIVFSQYHAVPGTPRKDYKELPSKNIDTGAGLERLACVMQATPTNFETDLFYPIIEHVKRLSHIPYDGDAIRAYRVIADHIRTLTFTLSDGAMFSNEGRGYVLRRLLRRALRYGRKLNLMTPFLSELVSTVMTIMEHAYPTLRTRQSIVEKMILQEEVKFMSTLHHGETLLKTMLETVDVLPGPDAFKLYDTFGFPIELTIEIARELNKRVDEQGFAAAMDEQKQRARAARQANDSMTKQSADLLAFTQPSSFLEQTNDIKAVVIGLFVDGHAIQTLEQGWVIFDQTPFYAESGGQIFDTGELTSEHVHATIDQVIKAPHQQHLHYVTCQFGSLNVGDTVTLRRDESRRYAIRQHHSAVHLLQASLKRHLGAHILQQGSYVGDRYARFDFLHHEKISEETLRVIEQDVNAMIQDAYPCSIERLPIEEAKKTGATAPFDEKYGDIVRIVTLGPRSKEFCGGTHVSNTSEIGVFAIMFEESIAAGTRRIQVVSGLAAYHYLKQKELLLSQIQERLRAGSTSEIMDRLKASIAEKEALKASNASLQDAYIRSLAKTFELITTPFPHLIVNGGTLSRTLLAALMDELKAMHPNSLIILTSDDHGVFPLAVFVSPSLQSSTRHAGQLVKALAQAMGGSGGGRPDLAFGSGKNLIDIPQWLKTQSIWTL